jgi:hypothetical protein
MGVPQKAKTIITIWSSNTTPEHTFQRNARQDTINTLAHPCLLQHYAEQPSYGNSPNVLQLMKKLRKCDTYIIYMYIYVCVHTHNGILFRHKRWNSGKLMEVKNIMVSEIRRVQKDKGCLFSLTCGRQIQIHAQALSYTHIYTEHVYNSGTIRAD